MPIDDEVHALLVARVAKLLAGIVVCSGGPPLSAADHAIGCGILVAMGIPHPDAWDNHGNLILSMVENGVPLEKVVEFINTEF